MHGIYLFTSSHNTIAINKCIENGHSGISMYWSTDCTVASNSCRGNTKHGLFVWTDSNNNTFTGNDCSDNDSGGSSYSGFYMHQSDGNTITGGQYNGNGHHGIYIFRSSRCTVNGAQCNNQNIGAGIIIQGDATKNSDYNSLTGNVCHDNGNAGIHIYGGVYVNKNIVVANQLTGNSGLALADEGTNTETGHNITS